MYCEWYVYVCIEILNFFLNKQQTAQLTASTLVRDEARLG